VETSSKALREFVMRHVGSTAVLAALAAALDAEVSGTPLNPILQRRIDDVLEAAGVKGLTKGMSTAELGVVLAEIRFNMFLDTKLLSPAVHPLAWTYNETEILQAGGEISAGFALALKNTIAPNLEGLEQRLESPDGAFLDIGVGVAGLAIAMARLWPSLTVVGIDPWPPSLALARENVGSAGLTQRIELREQAAEHLPDVNAFDLAWIPSLFMSAEAIPAACERVHRALRPGGWLLFALANPGNDPVIASIVRLRTLLWGGVALTPAEVETLLSRIGFVAIRPLPFPPLSVVALIAARRMPQQ